MKLSLTRIKTCMIFIIAVISPALSYGLSCPVCQEEPIIASPFSAATPTPVDECGSTLDKIAAVEFSYSEAKNGTVALDLRYLDLAGALVDSDFNLYADPTKSKLPGIAPGGNSVCVDFSSVCSLDSDGWSLVFKETGKIAFNRTTFASDLENALNLVTKHAETKGPIKPLGGAESWIFPCGPAAGSPMIKECSKAVKCLKVGGKLLGKALIVVDIACTIGQGINDCRQHGFVYAIQNAVTEFCTFGVVSKNCKGGFRLIWDGSAPQKQSSSVQGGSSESAAISATNY